VVDDLFQTCLRKGAADGCERVFIYTPLALLMHHMLMLTPVPPRHADDEANDTAKQNKTKTDFAVKTHFN
jgi:hypothetical protein